MATTNFVQLLLLCSHTQISYLVCIVSLKTDGCAAADSLFSALQTLYYKSFGLLFSSTVKKMVVSVILLQFAFGVPLHVTYTFSISVMRIAQTRLLNSQVCKHSTQIPCN